MFNKAKEMGRSAFNKVRGSKYGKKAEGLMNDGMDKMGLISPRKAK